MNEVKKPILEVKALTHIYGDGTPFRHVALDNINLSLYPGELVGIIGHTGSGKSTLIQHFNGLLKPTSGSICLDGEDIFSSSKSIRDARFRVGLVMQYPEYQLFEETVRKDISFGPKNRGLSGASLEEAVINAAKAVGLGDDKLDVSPFDLSGGEKRRAAIAGVIAMNPEILVLDEPTAGLDPYMRNEIVKIIVSQCRMGKTVVFVSHSMDIVSKICQRILVLNHSRIIMDGLPENVFSHTNELKDIGLALPELTELFAYMNQHGLDLGKPVYSMDYAVRKLIELCEKDEKS